MSQPNANKRKKSHPPRDTNKRLRLDDTQRMPRMAKPLLRSPPKPKPISNTPRRSRRLGMQRQQNLLISLRGPPRFSRQTAQQQSSAAMVAPIDRSQQPRIAPSPVTTPVTTTVQSRRPKPPKNSGKMEVDSTPPDSPKTPSPSLSPPPQPNTANTNSSAVQQRLVNPRVQPIRHGQPPLPLTNAPNPVIVPIPAPPLPLTNALTNAPNPVIVPIPAPPLAPIGVLPSTIPQTPPPPQPPVGPYHSYTDDQKRQWQSEMIKQLKAPVEPLHDLRRLMDEFNMPVPSGPRPPYYGPQPPQSVPRYPMGPPHHDPHLHNPVFHPPATQKQDDSLIGLTRLARDLSKLASNPSARRPADALGAGVTDYINSNGLPGFAKHRLAISSNQAYHLSKSWAPAQRLVVGRSTTSDILMVAQTLVHDKYKYMKSIHLKMQAAFAGISQSLQDETITLPELMEFLNNSQLLFSLDLEIVDDVNTFNSLVADIISLTRPSSTSYLWDAAFTILQSQPTTPLVQSIVQAGFYTAINQASVQEKIRQSTLKKSPSTTSNFRPPCPNQKRFGKCTNYSRGHKSKFYHSKVSSAAPQPPAPAAGLQQPSN